MKATWIKAALSCAVVSFAVATTGAAEAAPIPGATEAARSANATAASSVTTVHWRRHHRWHKHRSHRRCGYVRRCGYWGCRIIPRCRRR